MKAGEAQPPPTFDPRVAQDLPKLATVAFAEGFAAFKRALDPDGAWVWHRIEDTESAAAVATEAYSIDTLPRIEDSGFNLCEYIDELCNRANANPEAAGKQMAWSIQRLGAKPLGEDHKYRCTVVEVEPGGAFNVRNISDSNAPGMAMAMGMLLSSNFDFEKLHRELFPAQWLEIAS